MAEKAKVLYIEDESNLREMLAVDLEATLPITVIECGTAEDAIKILQNDTTKEIVIVLSDYNLPGNNGDTIYEYIRQTRPEIPFILHTSVFVTELKSFANFVDENSYNRIVQKPEVEEITITIQKYLDIKQGEEQEAPKYCKIATKRFLMFNTLAFDIFLRLSENKFIKIINKNELYMVDTIEQYISRDCEYLYITSGDYVPFLDHFTKTIKDRLICQEIPPSEQISLEVDCADLIQNHINFFSISDELMAVVDVVTTSNLKLIKKDPQLKSVIECMIQRKGFILEH
ncbi:MAG: response regulator, partial [Bdellovibrionales bacterium]|nr:response regulator [Bdellovibrionales bacterium]